MAGALEVLGHAEHAAIEEQTEAAAARPWQALGQGASEQCLHAMHPVAAAVIAQGYLPPLNPVGLVWPPDDTPGSTTSPDASNAARS